MASVNRTCMFDPNNRLSMYQMNDGDLALQTYNANNVHFYSPTLRTSQGGGKYTYYITDNGWEYNKTIFRLAVALLRDGIQEMAAPSLFKGIDANTLTPDTPIEMIQLPSDDGSRHLGTRFLKHGPHVGICTYNLDKDENKPVAVWLGRAPNYPLTEYLWESANKTFDYYQNYGSYTGFERKTASYGSLVAM